MHMPGPRDLNWRNVLHNLVIIMLDMNVLDTWLYYIFAHVVLEFPTTCLCNLPLVCICRMVGLGEARGISMSRLGCLGFQTSVSLESQPHSELVCETHQRS